MYVTIGRAIGKHQDTGRKRKGNWKWPVVMNWTATWNLFTYMTESNPHVINHNHEQTEPRDHKHKHE